MPDIRLQIELIVDDKGTATVQQFGRAVEDATRQGERAFDRLGQRLEAHEAGISDLTRHATSLGSALADLDGGLDQARFLEREPDQSAWPALLPPTFFDGRSGEDLIRPIPDDLVRRAWLWPQTPQEAPSLAIPPGSLFEPIPRPTPTLNQADEPIRPPVLPSPTAPADQTPLRGPAPDLSFPWAIQVPPETLTPPEKIDDAWRSWADAAEETAAEAYAAMTAESGASAEAQQAHAKALHAYQQEKFSDLVDLSRTTAWGMQDAFSEIFFDAFRGGLKDLSDYTDMILAYMQRSIANSLGRQTAQLITGYDIEGGGRTWGLAGAAVSGAGSLLGGAANLLGLGGFIQGAGSLVGDVVSGAGDLLKSLWPFQEGTAYVPQTMPALVHQGERILTSAQNQDLVALMAGLVGAEFSQTDALNSIAMNTSHVAANTAETAASLAPSGALVNSILSITGGSLVTFGTGNLGAGIAAGKGISWALGQLGIGGRSAPPGYAAMAAVQASHNMGDMADIMTQINANPSAYSTSPAEGGLLPGFQFGGEVFASGPAWVHAGEEIYTPRDRRDVSTRLGRLEKAVQAGMSGGEVHNHFHLHNEGVITTNDVKNWFANVQYEVTDKRIGVEVATKDVALAGMKM